MSKTVWIYRNDDWIEVSPYLMDPTVPYTRKRPTSAHDQSPVATSPSREHGGKGEVSDVQKYPEREADE